MTPGQRRPRHGQPCGGRSRADGIATPRARLRCRPAGRQGTPSPAALQSPTANALARREGPVSRSCQGMEPTLRCHSRWACSAAASLRETTAPLPPACCSCCMRTGAGSRRSGLSCNPDVRVVWIGGGVWPVGAQDHTLSNDIVSANVVFRAGIEIWQIPKPICRIMPPGYRAASPTCCATGAGPRRGPAATPRPGSAARSAPARARPRCG